VRHPYFRDIASKFKDIIIDQELISVLSKIGFEFNAGERDVPEAACFGPVARMVKGPKPAVSVATMA